WQRGAAAYRAAAEEAAASASDRQQFLFLLRHDPVDFLDVAVGQLLDVILAALLLVLADRLVFDQPGDFLVGVLADVAHGDLRAFAFLLHLLDQLLAALFGRRRHVDTDRG